MKFVHAFLVVALFSSQAYADAVSDWNDLTLRAVYNARITNFPQVSEILATVNVAMFDAANAVEREFEPYAFREDVPLGASSEAAVTGAAYTALIKIFPEQLSLFSNHKDSLAKQVADVTKRSDGLLIGEQAALAVLKTRQGKQVFAINNWRPITAPGAYVPTTFPASPSLDQAKPWMLASAGQYRPKPPPSLTSEEFGKDFNEVRIIGSLQSTARTPDQTQAGKFWAMSGVHGWNRALTQILNNKKASLLEHARCRALMNMALADSFIAAWEAKYYYNSWRPVTAIRNGDRTGNSKTQLDIGWVPLLETPLHPDYPSGHSANLGAALAVLEPFMTTIGQTSFSITSEDAPGIVRRFNNINEMGEEIANARVWAGIHFRFACTAGGELGWKIGVHALQNFLKPIPARKVGFINTKIVQG